MSLPPDAGEEEACPRTGTPVHLPLRKSAFTTLFSIRAKDATHSGHMEATAVLLTLRRLVRSGGQQHSHVMLLVDATAVVGALRKGRSSAPTLKHVTQNIAALALAAGIRLHVLYVHTSSNPADAPSRGIRTRPKPAPQRAAERRVRKLYTKDGQQRQWHRFLDRWDRYQALVASTGGRGGP